ncbi:MAG: porin family protein [Muribaculum sp.]
MKKLFVLAVIAVMALGASAQNWFIGGAFGYAHSTVETEDEKVKSDVFTIAPEVGYNIDETWAIGATLNYTWEKDMYNRFAISPYARYTFFRTDNNLVSLFVDGGFGIGYLKPDEGDSKCTWEIGFKPGLAVNLTEKFSLVAHVGFLGYQDLKEAGKTYGVNLDGRNITFGFYYNF